MDSKRVKSGTAVRCEDKSTGVSTTSDPRTKRPGTPVGVEDKITRVDGKLTLRAITKDDYGYLYSLLAQRTSDVYISSGRKLPTWRAHVAHWGSGLYAEAYIIMLEDLPAGYCYVSKGNEIGIHMMDQCQGHGIGPVVIRHLCRTHPGITLYANVSPYNIRSQQMFEKMGWVLLQQTYKFKQPNGD